MPRTNIVERLFSRYSCKRCIIIISYLYYARRERRGGGESVRFTVRKSDVVREIISGVTFSIGLTHESRPKNSLCRKFGCGSRTRRRRVYSKTVKSRPSRRRRWRWRAPLPLYMYNVLHITVAVWTSSQDMCGRRRNVGRGERRPTGWQGLKDGFRGIVWLGNACV